MTERLPRSEFSEAEQALIANLREKGPADPETRRMLLEWCDEEEAKVAEINTSRAGIELDLKKARIYQASGFHEEAWASLEAARTAAHNENAEDLFNEAEALMNEMDQER
ncbi:MAG TPA: hypothetical protein VMT99_01180 [Candidatus Paceibacterota bacterium]|nr:hypothetical protein [Candidatus Paceibacterota bacterium]